MNNNYENLPAVLNATQLHSHFAEQLFRCRSVVGEKDFARVK